MLIVIVGVILYLPLSAVALAISATVMKLKGLKLTHSDVAFIMVSSLIGVTIVLLLTQFVLNIIGSTQI